MLLDEDIVYSRRLIGVKVLRKQGYKGTLKRCINQKDQITKRS
nr:MAG TPA: hypothetical protein [Caudoviricetes sp.]